MSRDAYTILPSALSPVRASVSLGVRPSIIADWIKSGRLPVYKVGTSNKRRVFLVDLLETCRREWECINAKEVASWNSKT